MEFLVIKCSDCTSSFGLLHVYISNIEIPPMRLCCNCPKCGGASLYHEINKKFRVGVCDTRSDMNLYIENINFDITNNTLKYILGSKKIGN